jgi:DNA-binding NarL/FixJ family response regulator
LASAARDGSKNRSGSLSEPQRE